MSNANKKGVKGWLDPSSDAPSIKLLHGGSSEDFVNALIKEIHEHPALSHPYLVKLSEGQLPNISEAIKDYAYQYSFYSSWFIRYLEGVIASLPSENLKNELLENLMEEKGNPESEALEDKPHVEIFSHFKSTIGIDKNYVETHPATTTALLWRDLFLQKCCSEIPGVGVGAIGLATEYIVPYIYRYISSAIQEHTDFPKVANLFFRIHIECDEEHAESLIQVTKNIAEDVSTREAIRFGVFSALNLRNAFWDSQYARAMTL